MQRFSFWLLLACLLPSVRSADSKSSGNLPSNNAVSHAVGSFRPPSHVVRVEKYKYVDATNTSHHGNGGILEPVGDDAEQIPTLSTTAEYRKQPFESTTPFSTMATMQRTKLRLFDNVDRLIYATALPLSAVFAIIPIAGALDLFWVNRLGDTLAVAGQSAANQVYNSAFWLFAFLPTTTATLVSKSYASGDIEKTQDAVCQAMLFSLLIAIPGALLMFFKPIQALGSILKGEEVDFAVLVSLS